MADDHDDRLLGARVPDLHHRDPRLRRRGRRRDTIFGSDGRDILFGGGGNDVIYGFGGDDLIFGDQGKVTCTTKSYDPDDPRNGVCIDLGGTIDFRATNAPRHRHRRRPGLRRRGQRHRHGPAGQRHPLRRGRRRHPDRRLERLGRPRRRRRHRRRHRQRPHRRRQRRVLLPPRPPRPADAGADRHASSTARASRHGNDGHALVTGTVQNDPTRHRSTASRCSTTATPSRRTDRRAVGRRLHRGRRGRRRDLRQLGNDVIQGDGHVDGLVLDVYAHYGIDPARRRGS